MKACGESRKKYFFFALSLFFMLKIYISAVSVIYSSHRLAAGQMPAIAYTHTHTHTPINDIKLSDYGVDINFIHCLPFKKKRPKSFSSQLQVWLEFIVAVTTTTTTANGIFSFWSQATHKISIRSHQTHMDPLMFPLQSAVNLNGIHHQAALLPFISLIQHDVTV